MYANPVFDDISFGADGALSAGFNTVGGLSQPAHDRFEAGRRLLDALADDIALDAAEVDLEDLV